LTCDCIDCMAQGMDIGVEEWKKYLHQRVKYHQKNNKTGLDAFFD